MNPRHLSSFRHALLLPCLLGMALHARSASLLLDDFTTPAVAQSVVSSNQQFIQFSQGVFAGEAGQARDAYYWLYDDPLQSGASATIGGGSASVSAGAGALGEYGIGYGAYGVAQGNPGVQGPELGLDLTGYKALQVTFGSVAVAESLNVIVGLYTQAPKAGTGLYYFDQEVDQAPAVAGGPMTVNLLLSGNNASQFNFSQVDGIFFVVDRASNDIGNRYALTHLTFVDSVPEPSTGGLLLAGIAALGLGVRRLQPARRA